ncbi:MAG: tetratricopeptide repeat protein [Myxococcales bacterium]|nr:tetratricopeptide repeat protein [Myxococcota bacterium]MDW8283675.1 tetratricopeptide repeat protein [Myxococcales bacterium]
MDLSSALTPETNLDPPRVARSLEVQGEEQELAVRLGRAAEHLRSDRLDEAAAEITAMLERWPHDVRARNMLGVLHFRAGRFAEARAVYEALLASHGEDPSLRLNLGLVELRLGHLAEAVQHLGWVAGVEPQNTRAQAYYGLALFRSGDLPKARKVLQRAGQEDLVRQIDRMLGEEGVAGPSVEPVPPPAGPPPAGPSPPPASSPGRVAVPLEPQPSPRAREAVAEARRAIAASARALEAEQPFGPPEATSGGADRDWQVRAPAQELPPPTPPAPLRPIPVPQERTLPPAQIPSAAHAPRSLNQFLQERELAPPTDGSAFGVTASGLLVVRINGRLPMRSLGVVVSTGELTFEPVSRRARGRVLPETFGEGPAGLFYAVGTGMMVISPRGGHFVAISLSEEAVYLREACTFAFEESLHWENGRIPGSGPAPGHAGLPEALARMVQLRGTGQLVVRTERPLFTVRLAAGQMCFIEVEQLVGWTGRIIPSLLMGEDGSPTPYVECTGEGFLLVEPPPREGNPAQPTPPPIPGVA